MPSIEQYIQERIKIVRTAIKINPVSFHEGALSELQSVLSKIKHIS